ncbi:MAG: hypothetical protein LBF50_10865 [Azoarcus sp.]|jgi:cytochrome c biogenesis protein CcdA|nr:hypothetical protein [Azoarcus sp.]
MKTDMNISGDTLVLTNRGGTPSRTPSPRFHAPRSAPAPIRAPRVVPPAALQQRRLARHLMMATIYSFAIASATGIVLMLPLRNDYLALVALVAHLASGALTLIFLAPCLYMHLRNGKEPFRHLLMPWRLTHRVFAHEPLYHRVLGYLLMCCILVTLLSGIGISAPAITYLSGRSLTLSLGMGAALLRVHFTFAALALFFVLLHFPKRAAS